MRRSLILAALLCSAASPALADPITATIVSIGASWGAAQIATAYALGALATAALQIGVGLAVSLIASRFMSTPKPDFASMASIAQPVAYENRAYGLVRAAPTLIMTKFDRFEGWPGKGGNREYRVYVLALAAHEIDGIETWYLDDRIVTVSPTDQGVQEGPYGYCDVQLWAYDGAAGQVADPQLVDIVEGWTTAHDMADTAYIIAKQKKIDDSNWNEIYPNGKIQPVPAFRGNAKIYDPRTGETGYSDNWALCFAHELTHYQGLTVDWDEVAYEADQCDALVPAEGGTTRRRWRIGQSFTDDMQFADIRDAFLNAADGYYYERADGVMSFRAGRWTEPTITLTMADFQTIQISSVPNLDAANEYVTQYIAPDRDYRSTPTGAWVVDPEGGRTRREVKAEGVGYYHQAVALAKRQARADHADIRISGTIRDLDEDLRGYRFVAINIAEMGLSCVIEVQKLTLSDDWCTWQIEGVSTVMDDWMVAAGEFPDKPVYTEMSSSEVIDPVTSLRMAAGASTSGSATLIASWDAQDESYTQQLRWSLAGQEEWSIIDVPKGSTREVVPGFLDGAEYEWQIRNQRNGKSSVWSPSVNVRAVADTTPPPALPRFEVTGGSSQAIVDWDTPNSPKYVATRIFRGTTTDFNAATLVATSYGPPNVMDQYTDAVTAGTYRYWARPINGSGVAGPISGPETVTVL